MGELSQDSLAAALAALQAGAHVVTRGFAGRPRPGPDLRSAPYIAYRLKPGQPGLAGLTLIPMLAGEPDDGLLGIELVSPRRQIIRQVTRPLSAFQSLTPAYFRFAPIPDSHQGTFYLRVFVRDCRQAVRILEFRFLSPPSGARRLRARPLCGLLFLRPGSALAPALPAPYAEQARRVSEVWGQAPAAKSLWGSRIYREDSMRRLTGGTAPHYIGYVRQQYLPARPAPRALSLGCGLGDLERAGFEAGLFENCLGLDLSDGALQAARDYARQLGYPLEYQQADLNHLALRDRFGEFDLIFANASLHHVERLEALMAQVDAALKPDGLFFFHEYVGPARFQWTPKALDICNRLLAALPPRLRPEMDRVRRMTPEEFAFGDPSEAIRSDQIMGIAAAHFDLLETRDAGTTLTHPLLNDIIRYFDEDDESDAAILRLIFLFEEILIEEQVLESDVKLAIYRKRSPARPPQQTAAPRAPGAGR